jgi:hypothetical protein
LRSYKQQALADSLISDLEAWELAGRLRAYLTMMRDRVDRLTDVAERMEAVEWLQWCERYTDDRDPSTEPIAVPTVKAPGYSELADFRKRLDFDAGWWR